MKKLILNMHLALGFLLISSVANAALPEITTDVVKTRVSIETGINKIIKIRANKVTTKLPGIGVGFETSIGQRYSLDQVKHINPNSKSALSRVLQRDRIELLSGDIIYREEIEYGLIKIATGINTFNPLQKAPHTPD